MSAQDDLQKLVVDTLSADTAVMALASKVYDRVPTNPWGAKNGYISLGPHNVVDDDADCITGGIHTLQIDCWSRQVGRVHVKRMVDSVKAALHERELSLAAHALVEMRVTNRSTLPDPDGLTSHGIVTVTAMIEEKDA